MRGINHPARPDEYSNVRDPVGTVSVGGPEDLTHVSLLLVLRLFGPTHHIAWLGTSSWKMLAHAARILGLSCTRNGLSNGFADRVLRKTGAVESSSRRTTASSPTPNIGKAFLALSRRHNKTTAAA